MVLSKVFAAFNEVENKVRHSVDEARKDTIEYLSQFLLGELLFKQVQQFVAHTKKSSRPTLPSLEDAKAFMGYFKEEVEEGEDWIKDYEATLAKYPEGLPEAEVVRLLAKRLDWHGDCIIYHHSNAEQHGQPLREGLNIIMQSNLSKFGPDGKPIVNPVTGKIEKHKPTYWAPEQKLEVLISDKRDPRVESKQDEAAAPN